MRPFRSLQFKISAGLFLVGVLLITLSALRVHQRSVQSRRASMRDMAFAEGSRLSGMSQHLLRRRVSRAADLELSYASTNPDLRLGLILDGDDVVRHATHQQLRGLTLKETSLDEYAPFVMNVRSNMEGRVYDQKDRMVAIFPFWEGLARGKGCVILEYDLMRPIQAASAVALHASLAQALALSGGCLALWLMLKLVVTQRVAALVTQVRGMDLEVDPSPGIGGHDELTQVSAAVRTTHERLRHSEQRLSQIATNMRDVFWLAPAEKNLKPYVNEAYTRVFEREAPRLLTHRWDWLRSLVHDDRRRCLEILRSLRDGGEAQEIEVRVASPDGSLRWLRCRGFAVTSSDGHTQSVAGIAMDVSDRKNLERRLLDTAEKERRRIGMDLHDDLCQRLAAALMKTGVLQSALAKAGSSQGTLATELAGDLSDATGIARGFARGLAPVGIEALGLPAALSDLGDFITRGFKVPCRVECSASDTSITGEPATHIFRVAQELATNAAKHARPSWIEISFEVGRTEARLVITHDGTPYRQESTHQSGMGMHLVRQRLDALGASLTFHAAAEDEPVTAVECLIPLSHQVEPPTYHEHA